MRHWSLAVGLAAILGLVGCSSGNSGSGNDGAGQDDASNQDSNNDEQAAGQTYSVSITAATGGSLSLTGTQQVDAGTVLQASVTPDTGYQIVSVSGCDGTLNGNTFTTAAINADCSIEAAFERIEYTVTMTVSGNGSVTPESPQTIAHGDTLALTLSPDTGHYASAISGCDGTRAGNTYTTAAIIDNCSIDITFSVQISLTGTLNDTGITLCGNYDAENEGQWSSTLACDEQPTPATKDQDGYDQYGNLVPAGQDAHYGRDALAAAGSLSKVGGGAAGFDFTKLDSNGNDLPESASNWSCVRDNVTGLIWEVKEPSNGNVGDSLHDADDRYNWYNTDSSTNGGSVGFADDDGAICYGYNSADSTTYCNTEAFVNRVNAAGLCGANDWRMPKKEELRSIVHYGRTNPSIDADYFPNTMSNWYWSGSPRAYNSSSSWIVNFVYGFDSLQLP